MKNSSYNKNSLRLWFVKKILKNHLNKEEMFSFITDLFPKNEEIVDNNLNKFKDVNENELISNILEISNKTVQDIMIPRAEIISVSNKSSLDEILKLIDEENHSRMPVYEDNLDNVIGMIHVKDILEQIRNKNFHMVT